MEKDSLKGSMIPSNMKKDSLPARLARGFLQGRTSLAMGKRLHKNFKNADIDLTQEQFSVLSALWENDGLSQQELCTVTFREGPAMTRLLDNLEKGDWIIRKTHPSDRRTNLIYVTTKANQFKDTILSTAEQTIEECLHGISAEDLSRCIDVLAHIFNNLKE